MRALTAGAAGRAALLTAVVAGLLALALLRGMIPGPRADMVDLLSREPL
jgi:hypothetical protein